MRTNLSNQAGKGGELSHNETTIISGALDLTAKTARDAMTPLTSVFSLDLNAKLDKYAMPLHFNFFFVASFSCSSIMI